MNILIVGSGARELAIARALARSPSKAHLFCFGTNVNPGILPLTQAYCLKSTLNCPDIVKFAQEKSIDLAIIGPEAPLAAGIVDILQAHQIATLGPSQSLARIETSKVFTRDLLTKYGLSQSPHYRYFTTLDGIDSFLHQLGENNYVIKANGLMAGKGVKVAGEHLHSFKEAYTFCESLIKQNISCVIEEKLIGQEFSLLCFTDGQTIIPMPLVQDHKRAFIDDQGPNTGGMGSYSMANHSLPFLNEKDIKKAQAINEAVLLALAKECQQPYRGILYGSFIATQTGVEVIEYNARFGDPEAINILAILDGDFTQLCYQLTQGNLSSIPIKFKPLSTVCKYAVPQGYPETPLKHQLLDISQTTQPEWLYYANINQLDGDLIMEGSRAVAVLGVASTLEQAEALCEAEINKLQGPIFHRSDIGTAALIAKRIASMQSLRQGAVVYG